MTVARRAKLLFNGAESAEGDIAPYPVVKFFAPDAGASHLLTELALREPDTAIGLCDQELDCLKIGYVHPSKILAAGIRLGLQDEQDRSFTAAYPYRLTLRLPYGPNKILIWRRSRDLGFCTSRSTPRNGAVYSLRILWKPQFLTTNALAQTRHIEIESTSLYDAPSCLRNVRVR